MIINYETADIKNIPVGKTDSRHIIYDTLISLFIKLNQDIPENILPDNDDISIQLKTEYLITRLYQLSNQR